MSLSWEKIVDYARGIASPAVRQEVESDVNALSEVKWIQSISATAQLQAPELWKLRAKALVPMQVQTLPLLFGQLFFTKPTLQPGFRSAQQSEQRAKLEIENGTIEVSVSTTTASGNRILVGVIEATEETGYLIGTSQQWLTETDEDGQFSLEVGSEEQNLLIKNKVTGNTIQLELIYEN